MEKRKFKFNIVDFAVIAAIVIVILFAIRVLDSQNVFSTQTQRYKMTFYTEESTMYSLENIEVGAPACDEHKDQSIGTVVDVDIKDTSHAQVVTADGRYVEAHRPGYGSGSVVIEGEGIKYNHGAQFGECKYSVGQTVTIKTGTSKLFGRIMAIEIIE